MSQGGGDKKSGVELVPPPVVATAKSRDEAAALSLPYYESEAKKRETAGINQHSPTAKLPEGTTGESREKAAEALNVSGNGYPKTAITRRRRPEIGYGNFATPDN